MVTPKPLHEKLLTSLRHLLGEGDLPLNRNGAAGWLKEENLWLVSKRAMDVLRAHLTLEGHGDISSSNDRLFDVLQEHRILIPNRDRAIWRAQVAGEGWCHELTLLRLSARIIWPNPGTRPEPFAGTITPLDTAETDSGKTVSESLSKREAVQRTPWQFYPPKTYENTDKSVASPPGEPTESDEMGKRFLQWLRERLLSGHMEINTVRARAHIVAEGLLLVSPGIFKDFTAQNPDVESWNTVQKRFLKLRVHQKTRNGTNIFRYRVQGPRRKSTINGVLIPNLPLLFGDKPPPASNSMLSSLED